MPSTSKNGPQMRPTNATKSRTGQGAAQASAAINPLTAIPIVGIDGATRTDAFTTTQPRVVSGKGQAVASRLPHPK